MTTTAHQQGPYDDTPSPRLHKAHLLALQSKLERMGYGWIIIDAEAPLESSSSHMTAGVAKLSVTQVWICYDLCHAHHYAQVPFRDCTLDACTVKTRLQHESHTHVLWHAFLRVFSLVLYRCFLSSSALMMMYGTLVNA